MKSGCIDETIKARILEPHAEAAVATLAAAMIVADDVIDQVEIDIAYAQGETLGVTRDAIDCALALAHKAGQPAFHDLLGAVPPEARQAAATLLFEIADADGRLDQREIELLDAVRATWNVDLKFINRPLVWDKLQKDVIEGSADRCVLVSAGPGMGKTAVACARVAHLVEAEHVHDGGVWLVSFTRAAVAELNNRIDAFADDPKTGLAVKISTLDSQAWKLRHGFEAAAVEKLFGGFETSIEKAIDLLRERDSEIREYFEDMEHVLVDEAQDITGIRARFLMELFQRLPKTCGVTIFHDDAQAIYDHALAEADDYRFVAAIRDRLKENLEARVLKKIYRTEDPKLLSLYEMLRLDILDTEAPEGGDRAAFDRRTDIVRQAAHSNTKTQFQQSEIKDGPDPLVLFRRRVEVARRSSYLSKDGVAHRLRMSGLPKTFAPWIALTLGRASAARIDEAEFRTLHQEAIHSFSTLMGKADDAVDRRWDVLRRTAGDRRGLVDIDRLRAAARRKPDGLVMSEYGNMGPILGTIHASKGREADRVVLQLHKSWGSAPDTDFAEESRVLFVGASRARKELSIRQATGNPFARKTSSGRVFVENGKWKNAYQIQVGIDGDYDPLSALHDQNDIVRAAAGFNAPFSCTANRVPDVYTYALEAEDRNAALGELGPLIGRDCMEIGKICKGVHSRGHWYSPQYFQNVYVHGFSTAIAKPDVPLPVSAGAFGGKGVWLVPLISGFTMAFLK